MNINKVIIIGRITKNIELKSLTEGTNVANFTVAVGRNWKDKKGNKKEETDFINIVSFGKQAEIINQYFIKGQEIYVEGRLKTRSWEDKTGNKRYKTEVILEKFDFGQKPKERLTGKQIEDIDVKNIPY